MKLDWTSEHTKLETLSVGSSLNPTLITRALQKLIGTSEQTKLETLSVGSSLNPTLTIRLML